MKILKIIVLCILASPLWAANRPEDIPSKLTEVKARNWYQEKYRSWRTYLESNVQDKKGWVECFKAAQYSGATNSELSALASEINELFPNSGEANWTMAKSLGYSEKGVLLLEKALADLKSVDVIADKIVLAEIKGTDRTQYSSELFQTNMMYPSILNYAYNTLMSVGENGVLITEGENTTIPIWVLQDELGVRRDVKILNLELLGLENYQQQLFEKYDIQSPIGGLENLTENNPELSFYYALTLPKQNFELLNDKLYVVGLASLLSEKEINNYETLKENIEDQFLLDYLTVDFNGEPKTATGKTLETNYIVPFYLLKQYYDQQGNAAKSKFLEEQIKSIADRSQIGGRVNMLLSQKAGPKNFKIVELDVKTLDKRYVKVKDNIYASEYELDNRDYQFFLTYLEKNNYNELYDIAKFDFSGYDEVNTAFAKTY
ncbi:MAG TPA: hypothetical protein DHN29_23485, partial [Cytophagales bacterium]|nr:hypothetical protein [Cytophagales bacterium]